MNNPALQNTKSVLLLPNGFCFLMNELSRFVKSPGSKVGRFVFFMKEAAQRTKWLILMKKTFIPMPNRRIKTMNAVVVLINRFVVLMN